MPTPDPTAASPPPPAESRQPELARLRAENADLRARLDEAEDTLRAIRNGDVDAFVVEQAGAKRVYTLESADRPYRVLVEQMRQGAVTLDAFGTITYSNSRFAELVGVPLERLVGVALADFIPPGERSLAAALVSEGRAGGAEGETRVLRADGTVTPVYLTASPLPLDGGHEVGVLFTDLTEPARESERRFRTMVDQVKDYAIFMAGPDGRATTWNEGVQRVLGFDEAEFVGVDIATNIFTPEDVAAGVPEQELSEAAETGTANDDRWMRRKDGTHFWAMGITTALRDAGGRLIGFTKVMRDQTDWKRMEERLCEHVERLEKLSDELHDRDRRKDEFLATLAHELRNPLAPVRTALRVMRLAGGDAAAVEQARAMMERQVAVMVRLVDDLLDVSRITRGKVELRTQKVDLAAVLHGAVETSLPVIQASGHELTLTLPPESLTVFADPTRLAQVVSNLLNNAAKYTPPGGRVGLSAGREGGEVVLRVRDTGVGIAPDMLPRVFDLFTQVAPTADHSQGGLGIGLTLVRALTEMHGGTVHASSGGPGLGSEFAVRLPLEAGMRDEGGGMKGRPKQEDATAEVASSFLPSSLNPYPSSLPKVLLVDDNVDGANSLAVLLGLTGYETRVAHDGPAGLAAAEAFRPDVVLLDIGLPGMSGYEVAHQLRQRPATRGAVLVALTGWGTEDDRRRSREAGFDHHLTKPADPDDLEKLLASLRV